MNLRKSQIVIIALILISYSSNAQVHNKFLGIDMNCTIDDITPKIIEKGYTFDKEIENARIFTGVFLRYDCDVCVAYSNKTGNVFRGSIIFEPLDTKSEVKKWYEKLCYNYSEKFGEYKTKIITEKLKHDPRFDFTDVTEISCWEISGNFILISLYDGFVKIDYEDTPNLNEYQSEYLDEL